MPVRKYRLHNSGTGCSLLSSNRKYGTKGISNDLLSDRLLKVCRRSRSEFKFAAVVRSCRCTERELHDGFWLAPQLKRSRGCPIDVLACLVTR